MKIVITGAGFIGSALAEHFSSQNNDVFVVSKEPDCPFNLENVVYVSEDLTLGHEMLKRALENSDICICTAAICGVLKFAYDPTACYQNCLIDQNTLAALSEAENGADTVVYFSSSEVYGECKNAKETDKFNFAQTTRGGYAAEKVLGEYFYSILCMRSKSVRIVRPFNVVGRYSHKTGKQSRGFLLPNLVQQAQEGKPLTIYNNESRCYLDIRDLVAATAAIATAQDLEPFEVFNIANPKNKYSNNEVAELVQELSGTSSEIVSTPVPEIASCAFRKANISKLQKIYKPKFPLVSSIKNMLQMQ